MTGVFETTQQHLTAQRSDGGARGSALTGAVQLRRLAKKQNDVSYGSSVGLAAPEQVPHES